MGDKQFLGCQYKLRSQIQWGQIPQICVQCNQLGPIPVLASGDTEGRLRAGAGNGEEGPQIPNS